MGSVHLSETRRLIGPPPFPPLSAGPLDDVPIELLLPGNAIHFPCYDTNYRHLRQHKIFQLIFEPKTR